MEKRKDRYNYYLAIAKEVASRSTCFRYRYGVVIVRNDQIISTGYVGAPRGTKDCMEKGFCFRKQEKIPHGQRYELCCSVHAEQNAIINAARGGVSLLGARMYIWGAKYGEDKPVDAFPCFICKKMIMNAGIEAVFISLKDYKGGGLTDVQHWIEEWNEYGDKDFVKNISYYEERK